jgi:leader peptidase (prepilin peptidase)/N-methyltransferase
VDFGTFVYIVVFVLGLLFGSFFNVAIHRWPREDPKEREWVKTPSHCPRCGKAIRWYDNIPLLSWIILGAQCRDCKAPISWRYPLVELGNACLWLLTAWMVQNLGLSGVEPERITLWHVALTIGLVSCYFLTVIIDFETGLLPDEISIPNFIIAWLMMWLCNGATISPDWLNSLIGMFALAAIFAIFAWFGGMGWGDVLFALGMGVTFGWQLVLAVGLLGIFMGGIVGLFVILVLMLRRKYKLGHPMPFGPYLAIASFIGLFWIHDIANWYLKIVGLPPAF